eukprot:TRINITY_DN22119_c0_g1_i1.p1 TRINITY_DN22119_c0_g1~~TRINITY_DN22119_c0_g1_i1.p1  ORF type:complete len:326 (+),score=104.01 TRINITY_DN22119_c0_g1_i1:26-979(+)
MSHRRKETRYMCKYCNVWIHNNVAARTQHEKTKTHQEKAREFLEKQQSNAAEKKKQEREKQAELERINEAALAAMTGIAPVAKKVPKEAEQHNHTESTAPSGMNRKQRRAMLQKDAQKGVFTLPPAPVSGWSETVIATKQNDPPQKPSAKTTTDTEQEKKDIEYGGEVAFGSAAASTMWGWSKVTKKIEKSRSRSSSIDSTSGTATNSIKRPKEDITTTTTTTTEPNTDPDNSDPTAVIEALNASLAARPDAVPGQWSTDTPTASTVVFKKKKRRQSSASSDEGEQADDVNEEAPAEEETAAPVAFKQKKQRNLRKR